MDSKAALCPRSPFLTNHAKRRRSAARLDDSEAELSLVFPFFATKSTSRVQALVRQVLGRLLGQHVPCGLLGLLRCDNDEPFVVLQHIEPPAEVRAAVLVSGLESRARE